MSTGKTTLFYSFLIMVASLAVGMVIASRLDLTPASSAQGTIAAAPPMNSAPLSGPVDASTFRNIAKAMSPAVVNIRSTSKQRAQEMTEFFGGGGGGNDDLLERFFGGQGRQQRPQRPREQETQAAGTGFVINKTLGYILTNNHVVEGATKVEVNFLGEDNDVYHEAKIVGRDPLTDSALIQLVDKNSNLIEVKFGDSSQMQPGDWVMAIGNPFGFSHTVSVGVVSGIGRENINLSRYENFIQTDASINPGNSGGPLFNLRGEVIGINTAIINFAQGIGFAIPSNMAKQVIEQLLAKGKVVRGWLGVGIQPLTAELAKTFGVAEGEGVLVNEVFEKDPAALAGIKPGDVIVRIDGAVVDSPNKLSRLIATHTPGATSKIEVVRDLKHITLDVPLTERRETAVIASIPQQEEKGGVRLGLEVQDLTAALAERFKLRESKGVLIVKVEPNSLAQAEGLREGDLIKEVNRREVSSVGEFTSAIARSRRGDTLLLRVLRENRAFYVVLKSTD